MVDAWKRGLESYVFFLSFFFKRRIYPFVDLGKLKLRH